MAYLGKSPTEVFRAFSVKDTFTGDGSTTVFTLSRAAFVGSPNDVQVFVDNVRQEPGSGKAYTIALDGNSNATQLTFTSAPPSAAEIYVIISAEPTSVVVPADSSVTTAKIADGSITSAKIADGTVIAADVGDNVITGAKLKSDISITTSGNITTTGAFTSTGIDDNATSTAITIDSSENVGIGTTSPSRLLHLNSTSSENNTYLQLTSDATGTGTLDGFQIIVAGNDGSTVLAQRENSSLQFRTNNTERMRIASGGDVGIGTTSPTTKLDVVGTGVNGIELGQQIDNTANSSRLFFNNSTNIWTAYSTTGNFKIASGATIGATSGTDRLVIDSSGNVGIGTSSPDEKLTVSGDMNVVSGSTYKIKAQVSSSYALNLGHDRIQIVNAANNPFLFYYGSTERMRITSAGNVGIGTTSPDYKLQVDGDIVPEADNTYDLGKSSLAWANIYTGDLHLSNENKEQGNDIDGTKGNWTIQEGETDLYIINNKNGKKFKFKLEEIV